MRGLYWIRSDLRIHDNATLNRFSSQCDEGLFVWAPSKSYMRSAGHRRLFIDNCVKHFSQDILPFNHFILKTTSCMSENIRELIFNYQIEKVFFTREFAFEEVSEEQEIIRICIEKNIAWEAIDQGTLIAQNDLPFTLENMPFIFTDFRKKIEAQINISAPLIYPVKWPKCLNSQVENNFVKDESPLFYGGEKSALSRVNEYLWKSHAIETYKETRNGLLEWNDSSKLSPWLSVGALSSRLIYSELKKYEYQIKANESTYWLFFELLWRDYFKFFSRKYGKLIFQESGIKLNNSYKPQGNDVLFHQWCNGDTSEPFINANMLELKLTGWMSNRGRQNVASFLIHELKLPWTLGAKYFEENLIDYDCDVNWGNWLYLSGNGSDPRSRIFNSQRQAELYDPLNKYQSKWIN